MKRSTLLTILILVALFAGAIVGEYVLYDPIEPIDGAHWSKWLGDLILIRPLKLMIIPLVFVSVVVGVSSIGDPSRLGVVGGATVLYYLVTMLIAVSLGAMLVSTVSPGSLSPEETEVLRASAEMQYNDSAIAGNIDRASSAGQDSLLGAWKNILMQVVPTNLVSEMANGRTLGVISAALLFGLGITVAGPRGKPVADFFEALFQVLMVIVGWIIWLTPIGCFFLVAWTVGMIGFDNIIGPLLKYIGTVIFGLLIHATLVLPLILFIMGRTNPYRFMWRMRPALMTAFATDSSSATLPVTIETAQTDGGCSKRASKFVLPLGSTVNMDGTALYEAVAVVFLFQLYGIELGFSELVIVVITATLAAIGAAGIPSAGLVTMVIVIAAVNTSLGDPEKELPLSAIGVILGVDRIVDMCRTTVNVWGDAVGAKIITRIAPDK